MNCQGCTKESCWECGYKYGMAVKRKRAAARRKARHRRVCGTIIALLFMAVASVGAIAAAHGLLASHPAKPEASTPTYVGEPTISDTPVASPIKAETVAETVPAPEAVDTDENLSEYSEEDREIVAIIVYQEAGGDDCSDDTRLKVGTVFFNRVASEKFAENTIYDVAMAKGQYGRLYWTGIKWPDRASEPGEAHAVARAYEIADRLLDGERAFDEDVIWQAEFPQGIEIVSYQDGIYFCK